MYLHDKQKKNIFRDNYTVTIITNIFPLALCFFRFFIVTRVARSGLTWSRRFFVSSFFLNELQCK